LGLSRGRKCLLSSIRPLESSLNRLEKTHFSPGQGAENYFKVPLDHLNPLFFDFTQIAFWADQEVGNNFAVPCNHWKHRFLELTQAALCGGQGLKTNSECLEATLNIAFSTSSKSHFVMVKRPKMSSKCNE